MIKQLIIFPACALLMACASSPEQPKPAASTPTASTSKWDDSYGGVDKSYDTNLLKLRSEIAPRFQQLTYQDSVTGRSMAYNLYIPKGYQPGKSYPLIMFIADASTVGRGVKAPLMQGYGGIIWATDESQAKHPAFVLVPSFAGINGRPMTIGKSAMRLGSPRACLKTPLPTTILTAIGFTRRGNPWAV